MHFRERPWDLFLSEGYVVAFAALVLWTGQGLLVAILLIFFVPGYLLVAALFPRDGEINWIERIALSSGLSLAVVPLLALGLNFSPFALRLVPIVLSLVAFSAVVGMVAYLRRMQLPAEERLSVTLEIRMPAWREYSAVEKALVLVLVAALLSSLSILAVVLTTPRPGERFSEFYILGPEARAENYPTNLTVSDSGTIIIGVVNHEFSRIDYAVQVDLVDIAVGWNATAGRNETLELDRGTLDRFEFTLGHGANWTRTYTFQIFAKGDWQVQLLLYKNGSVSDPHLQLFVTVTG